MKNILSSAVKFSSAVLIVFLTSCASEKVATQPAPPVIIEKASPGPTYVLRGPEWRWDGTKRVYVYAPGEWVERHGAWVPGHWKNVRGGVKWVPGHWQ